MTINRNVVKSIKKAGNTAAHGVETHATCASMHDSDFEDEQGPHTIGGHRKRKAATKIAKNTKKTKKNPPHGAVEDPVEDGGLENECEQNEGEQSECEQSEWENSGESSGEESVADTTQVTKPVTTPTQTSTTAPPLRTQHKNWDALTQYLEGYQRDTYQLFRYRYLNKKNTCIIN